jgi:hypothetical protein
VPVSAVCNRSSVQKSPPVLLVSTLSASGGGCYKKLQLATWATTTS